MKLHSRGIAAEVVQQRTNPGGSRTACTEHGPPWETGYWKSFKAGFRDELFNGKIFYHFKEANIAIEQWRKHYNALKPHFDTH